MDPSDGEDAGTWGGIASPPRCNKVGTSDVSKGVARDASRVGDVVVGTRTTRSKEAFEAMATQAIPGLYALARRLTDRDPEDPSSECLLRAYRAYDGLEDDAAGPAWLRRILVNAFRDRLRKGTRSVEEVSMGDLDDFSLFRTLAEEDPFPYSDTLHLDFLRAFGRDDVLAVLLRMPARYRAALVLRYIEGFSTKEIARLMDEPLGTVLAQLHRGRKRFERELWDYANEAGLLSKGASR